MALGHGAVFYSGQPDSRTCSADEPPLLSFSQLLLLLLLFACRGGGGRHLVTGGQHLRHPVEFISLFAQTLNLMLATPTEAVISNGVQYQFLMPLDPPRKVYSC